MRIRKWEKWYFRIVFAIFIGLTIWLLFREKGFGGFVDGQKETLSKTKSFLLFILMPTLMALWVWFCIRIWISWFLRSDDFICKVCHKEFGKSFETRKNVCKTCYEKRKH